MAVQLIISNANSAVRTFVLVTLTVLSVCGSLGRGSVLRYLPAHSKSTKLYEHNQPEIHTSSSAGWYSCFENNTCRCFEDNADCSRNYGRLAFIPILSIQVRFLNFSLNSLPAISRNFFTNVTYVSSIDLSNNDLTFIHPAAFEYTTNLTCIFLRYNSGLTYLTLDPVFSLRTLQKLDLSDASLGELPVGFFQRYSLWNLRSLNMFGNRLISVNLTVFAKLFNLTNLELGYNDLSSAMTDSVMKIEALDLEQNNLREFPNFCENNTSLLPELTVLVLQSNLISSIPQAICLPRLRSLDLSKNSLNLILMDTFAMAKFPKLEQLHLDSMTGGIVRVEDYAFNNQALEMLSLANNNLNMNEDDAVKPGSFRGCYHLTKVLMNGNVFGETSDKKVQELFGVLPLLHELDLSSTQIKNISNLTFSRLPSLQQLTLSSNLLKSLPDGVFDMCEMLAVLDISNNKLSVILEITFNASTRDRFNRLDLSGNSYMCSCSLLWFRQWFVTHPQLFNHSRYQYNCCCDEEVSKIPIKTYYKDKQACLLSSLGYIMLMSYSVGLIIVLPVYIIVRLVQNAFEPPTLIRALRGAENNVRFAQNEHYDYDVFVAYAEEDEEWVRGQLMPELEGRLGLKLCIHQRDFLPGRNILDNIEDSVEKSKRAMMIFSTHFSRSQWCQFELSLCQHHVMDNEDVLVVVCLEEVQPRDWTSGMLAILRTSTYIQWLEELHHRASFWNTALQDIIVPVQPRA